MAPHAIVAILPNCRLNLLALDIRNFEFPKALLHITSIGGIAVQVYALQSRESAGGIVYDASKDTADEERNLTLRGKASIVEI